MQSVSIYLINGIFYVASDNKTKAGFWIVSNNVVSIHKKKASNCMLEIILNQLSKTEYDVINPYSLPKEEQKKIKGFYHIIGFKSYKQFMKNSHLFTIKIRFENEIYNIITMEQYPDHSSFFMSSKIKPIELRTDEADKIVDIVLNIFK